MLPAGIIRYQLVGASHGKGTGDPAGGYVEIDTNEETVKIKPGDSGTGKSIALEDLPEAIDLYRDQEDE